MVTERLGISTALRHQIRLLHESEVQRTQKNRLACSQRFMNHKASSVSMDEEGERIHHGNLAQKKWAFDS